MSENPLPSIEYMLACPADDLQTIELSSLDRSAQLLKATKFNFLEAADQMANATVVRWFRENRDRIIEAVRRQAGVDPQTIPATFEALLAVTPTKDWM